MVQGQGQEAEGKERDSEGALAALMDLICEAKTGRRHGTMAHHTRGDRRPPATPTLSLARRRRAE